MYISLLSETLVDYCITYKYLYSIGAGEPWAFKWYCRRKLTRIFTSISSVTAACRKFHVYSKFMSQQTLFGLHESCKTRSRKFRSVQTHPFRCTLVQDWPTSARPSLAAWPSIRSFGTNSLSQILYSYSYTLLVFRVGYITVLEFREPLCHSSLQ